MNFFYINVTLLWAFFFTVSGVSGQSLRYLPVDTSIIQGKFENGLSYFIKSNPKPEGTLELRLVVKAGSLYEEDSEQGLAGFMEHMCFNGIRNFPGNEIITFFESAGMRFGRDLNALTSFTETKYMLSIPGKDPDLLEKAIQVLEDWAHQVSFEEEEVEKGKGGYSTGISYRPGGTESSQGTILPRNFVALLINTVCRLEKKKCLNPSNPLF